MTLDNRLYVSRSADSKTLSFTVTYDSISNAVDPNVDVTWLTQTGKTTTGNSVKYTYSIDSFGAAPDIGHISFYAEGSLQVFNVVKIHRVTPIWQDTYYEFSSMKEAYWLVNGKFNTVYSGIAYSPNQAASICVSRIVESQVEFDLPPNLENAKSLGGLFFCAITDSNGIVKAAWDFIYDWSYYIPDIRKPMLSNFWSNRFSKTMPFQVSIYPSNDSEYALVTTYEDNTTSTFYFSSFGIGINSVRSYVVEYPNKKIKKVEVKLDNELYNTYDEIVCSDWTLIWIAANGGIETMPIETNLYKTDSFERTTFEQKSNNLYPAEFAKRNLTTTITTEYSFSTIWLTDEQSEFLASNLFNSNYVWLHDNNSNEDISVLVKNSSAEHKKFENGRQLVRYDVTLEESKNKVVR